MMAAPTAARLVVTIDIPDGVDLATVRRHLKQRVAGEPTTVAFTSDEVAVHGLLVGWELGKGA